MYNRRVSKCHQRVEAYGSVDELNAAIGLARAFTDQAFVNDHLMIIQKDLVVLMGELATAVEDLPRYVKDGFSRVSPALTTKLEAVVKTAEAKRLRFQEWGRPRRSL